MTNNLPALLEYVIPFAMAAFLARYREPTVSAYRRDLLCWRPVAARRMVPPTSRHCVVHPVPDPERDNHPSILHRP